ncbi:MAG: MOSC domain-containing protein [Paracoccaceae bacterium]
MPTITRTDYVATVEWLGMSDGGTDTLRSAPLQSLDLGFPGLSGARHEGMTRPACVRTKMLYPQGTEIRNVRQLTVLSGEEMDAIAAEIGLDALDPCTLGVNIVLRGIPDFTHVPPGSRLQAESGATLTVDMENLPCVYPAQEIEADSPGHGDGFPKAAHGRRGVTAWVERPGALNVGDTLRLFIPAQRPWSP